MKNKNNKPPRQSPLSKCPTGIKGLDEISFGGLPKNTATLVTGGTGCGKTLFGMQFLIQGALNQEPGLFIAFEESKADLERNFTFLGMDFKNGREKKFI